MSDVLYNTALLDELIKYNDELIKCYRLGTFDIFEFIDSDFYSAIERANYIKHYDVKINYNMLSLLGGTMVHASKKDIVKLLDFDRTSDQEIVGRLKDYSYESIKSLSNLNAYFSPNEYVNNKEVRDKILTKFSEIVIYMSMIRYFLMRSKEFTKNGQFLQLKHSELAKIYSNKVILELNNNFADQFQVATHYVLSLLENFDSNTIYPIEPYFKLNKDNRLSIFNNTISLIETGISHLLQIIYTLDSHHLNEDNIDPKELQQEYTDVLLKTYARLIARFNVYINLHD